MAFDCTPDAFQKMDAFFPKTGKAVVALTVEDILEEKIAYKIA